MDVHVASEIFCYIFLLIGVCVCGQVLEHTLENISFHTRVRYAKYGVVLNFRKVACFPLWAISVAYAKRHLRPEFHGTLYINSCISFHFIAIFVSFLYIQQRIMYALSWKLTLTEFYTKFQILPVRNRVRAYDEKPVINFWENNRFPCKGYMKHVNSKCDNVKLFLVL